MYTERYDMKSFKKVPRKESAVVGDHLWVAACFILPHGVSRSLRTTLITPGTTFRCHSLFFIIP